ncbi:P-loop containing nucleoside triphosphate hydrolase protein [Cantharellus anzutake]|uniref:P-loop containing nucleoside triphosphate hydrolase protein n=1 Tax=Cantharellus anzutake TaxID=1750568 RepID=UPI001906A481|nr:P-loop containing nucleoside triphosphate hydrolase protein [Cantharellus anzutake]KAF8340724.1 P-loop containing nucleoside triphosphate hydrolase protein [Cantharellus anzutake]
MSVRDSAVGLGTTGYAKKAKELIKVIGDIRALGGQGDLDLPRIAVIGNQSAGKSSLIEAISGITVPRASGTCTRCPMECRLQQSDELWRCQVYLRFDYDTLNRPKLEVHEEKFGPMLHDPAALEIMLRRAQLAILNPTVDAKRFEDLDIDSLDDEYPPLGSSEQLNFSSNVVCVDVWGPYLPNLSFVDLPGIISNVADEKDSGNIDAVKNMVKKHIEGNCLILLTITMRDDIDNQSAAWLAKQADPDGLRTIGVLTKPDTLQDGEEKGWVDVLEGRKHPLKLGYYITKQPAPKDLLEKITHAEARAKERDFFRDHPTWSRLPKSRMGTEMLGVSLSKLLSQLIDRTLPKLREQVREQSKATDGALARLPAKITNLPAVEINALIGRFYEEMRSYVEGAQGYETLLHGCLEPYSTFRYEIRATAPVFDLSDPPKPADLPYGSGDATDESSIGGSSRKTTLQELRMIIDRHLTKELPGNVPFSAKLSCMLNCLKEWSALADACFDSVFFMAEDHCVQIARTHFDRFTYSSLNTIIRDTVAKELLRAKNEIDEKLRWVIKLESTPFTQNAHYFTSCKERYLVEYKAKRPTSKLIISYLENALVSLRAAGSSIRSIEEIKKYEEDPYEREISVAAEVRAYFQVAYKRIIDLVPRIINIDFISELHIRLRAALEKELGVGTEAGIKLAAKLLEEEPDVLNKREELEAKQKRLREIQLRLNGSLV